MRPMPEACSPHVAGVERGSHGELADGLVTLTDADRAGLEAGEPLVLRFAVSNDATHPGGLCLFGANTGELPWTRLWRFAPRPLAD